ncbi:hypothetical protein A3A39_00575 [Candidatus Kaiserbacteria bacterium RIFCSPLOWO2_01_FULL_54_13]|uniref:Uncharacterized protein n=1 Tax=Candidatus Kaiserbacteria bacterium RIFCSPLOWO2_01_FULL_54_13 TaxID=1798512 RepID=A0A1F6F0L5_9BACT|nr:MAG: hypothetical protein A3A39_00575 [Candidatus Kaiserbacteria bacterium RIFCSPLOWO2_01_FULL_54_13]
MYAPLITHRVLLLSSISQAAITKFELAGQNGTNCRFEVGKNIKEFDTVILRSTPFNVDEYPKVKLVIRAGTEANKVTGKRVENGEVCVQLTLGANSSSVAEEVLFATIGLTRKFHTGDAFVRTELDYSLSPKEFANGEKGYETAKARFLGRELSSQTIGVIGAGQIGIRVIQTMLLLGMRVIVYEKDRLSPLYKLLPPAVIKAESIEYVLANADIVTVHIPGENNKNLIDKDRIELMRPGSYLINCARAEICDGASILPALNEGRLGGYFTDIPEPSLPPHPLIMCQPHMGGNTVEAQERCGEMAAEQTIDFWRRGNMWPSKNMPTNVLEPAETAVMRLAVPHHNVFGVLEKIQHVIKTAKISISTSHNNTKDALGYYLVDLDQHLPEAQIEKIRRMPEVIDVMSFQF